MAALTDRFDLGALNLSSGEGRRLALAVHLEAFSFGGESYAVEPARVSATLDVSRMTGGGHALRLRFTAALNGPCMRCLEPAVPAVDVDAREIDQPGGGDELSSPYMEGGVLDLHGWARDALALTLPEQIVCDRDCPGLCPVCGVRLAEAGPGHGHATAADPRWAKLRELKLD